MTFFRYKLYIFWIYILTELHKWINNRIFSDLNNMYIVYYSNLIKDIYITENGMEALELVELLNKVNKKIDRPYVKILYGKVDYIYKHKIASLMDIIFCFNATEEQRKLIYKYIADVPGKIN